MVYSKLFKYKTTIVIIVLTIIMSLTGCNLASTVVNNNNKNSNGNSNSNNNSNNNPPSTPQLIDIDGVLHYESINQQTGGSSATKDVTPTFTGATDSAQTVEYSISPDLPTGASFDTTNGKISQLPIGATINKAYTITATGTGSYTGTITAEFKFHIAAASITGTLSYNSGNNIMINAPNAATQAATWAGVTSAGQTVEYSIIEKATKAPAPTGITINNSGLITIAATTSPKALTTYTVTAAGTGNYAGKVTADVNIAIQYTIDGTLSYENISMAVGTAKTISPSWASVTKTGQAVTYSVNPALSNGATIDTNTGAIIIAAGATATNTVTSYTITATGTGAYKGTKTTTMTIHLGTTAVGGTVSYTNTSHAYSTTATGTITPSWASAPAGQSTKLSYSIAAAAGSNLPSGITINSGTGVITIAASTPVQTEQTYTVTIKGTGSFAGKVTTPVRVNIFNPVALTGALGGYTDISMVVGTARTNTPSWTGVTNAGQTVTYSVNPGFSNGVTIDSNTGVVTITAGATATNTETTHTITATGTGVYVGTKTTTFKLHLATTAVTATLTYADNVHGQGNAGTINPVWGSSTPANQSSNLIYSIAGAPGGISINSNTGVITISAAQTVIAENDYTVTIVGKDNFAGSATSTAKIKVILPDNPVITAYNGTRSSDTGGAIIGPFLKDNSFAAGSTVLTITGLSPGVSYTYTLGSSTGTKTTGSTATRITILRSDISSTNAAANATLTLTGGTVPNSKTTMATYKPTDIYDWQDLQAMRGDLSKDYTLQKDITFPNRGTSGFPSAGFVPIGSALNSSFTGTFDGNNKVIKKLSIQNTNLTPAGLFGSIIGASPTTEVVKDLTIEDPQILAKCEVGALVGAVTKAKISNVTVKASASPPAGGAYVQAGSGSCTYNSNGLLFSGGVLAGGVVGLAYGYNNSHVDIISISSTGLTIKITGSQRKMIGGLVGGMAKGRVVGNSSNNITVTLSYNSTVTDVGGLVGMVSAAPADIIGSFSGTIKNDTPGNTFMREVGGLVGSIDGSYAAATKVYGHVSGTIDGGGGKVEQGGGLVGYVLNSKANIRGYFSGTIKKANQKVGGILGDDSVTHPNDKVLVEGYNRGFIQLLTTTNVGYIYGYSINKYTPRAGFYSTATGEGLFQNTSGTVLGTGTTPTLAAATATGANNYQGTGITVGSTTTQGSFTGFTFGTAEGTWSMTTGSWPTINLGTDYSP